MATVVLLISIVEFENLSSHRKPLEEAEDDLMRENFGRVRTSQTAKFWMSHRLKREY